MAVRTGTTEPQRGKSRWVADGLSNPTEMPEADGSGPRGRCGLLSRVKVLGLRSFRNKISWAVVEGADKAGAAVVAHRSDEAPAGSRGEQLKWIRAEMTDLINEHDPDSIVLCPTEGSAVSNAILERSQTDGVIMEVAHSMGKTVVAKKAATIRSNFGATNNATLLLAVNAFAAIKDIAPNAARREPAIAALSGFS